ncbi:hypothetical protein E4T38_03533 [Aureobasidium subglaciale]|nr:hypothetical protein E4T38_03533 [Aureobasidium subglaciale]KAI5225636.1 hypothetical protein E4T40_03308 [Aureobasidium subglaciale]KAI5229157.1 hypothetical protein E4T41_03628 [Aureobasidium subglaciale]KAI5263874.1 hypothetical protein E4T46_03307 [Aureobasidium subglaciale]
MALPTPLLQPSTWRTLGVSALFMISPLTGAASLGIHPSTPTEESINHKAMLFLGIRDISVAVPIVLYAMQGKNKEMGMLITAWTVVFGVDTWVAGSEGAAVGGLIGGTVFNLFVGLGLWGC